MGDLIGTVLESLPLLFGIVFLGMIAFSLGWIAISMSEISDTLSDISNSLNGDETDDDEKETKPSSE